MKTPNPRHSAIVDEAADWLVQRNAGFAPAEEAAFRRWLSADQRHAPAFAAVEATWQTLDQPRASGRADELARALNARAQRRTQRNKIGIVVALSLAAAAAIVVAFLPRSSRAPSAATPSTVAIRPDRQMLPDGSIVELDAGAAIAIDFTSTQRGVRLLHGEALFAVAKDAIHPFIVTAGDVEVRAVGTAFSARNDPKQVAVLVTEGRVSVARASAAAATDTSAVPARVYLGMGERLSVPADPATPMPLRATALTPGEMTTALAWRGRRVEFTGTTLSEAIDVFNRQNGLKLSLADPTVARQQISGIFWSDDPDGFVRLLEAGMNVQADRSPGLIVLRRP